MLQLTDTSASSQNMLGHSLTSARSSERTSGHRPSILRLKQSLIDCFVFLLIKTIFKRRTGIQKFIHKTISMDVARRVRERLIRHVLPRTVISFLENFHVSVTSASVSNKYLTTTKKKQKTTRKSLCVCVSQGGCERRLNE